MNKSRKYPLDRKPSRLLKLALGIFVATEEMPYSANEFVQKTQNSAKRRFIWFIVGLFWSMLVGIVIISLLFFKNNYTLFKVNATTEIVNVTPFVGVNYPNWHLDDATLYLGCEEEVDNVSGELVISDNADIEFRRIKNGLLEITLSPPNDSPNDPRYCPPSSINVGTLLVKDRASQALCDCTGIVLKPSKTNSYTFPIDGLVEIGGGLKHSNSRTPILYRGRVHIADRTILSNEYYLSEPKELKLGDEFSIEGQTTQSSGLVFVDESPGMQVTYSGKGTVGIISSYKAEKIQMKNNFWTKLYNDETVILLWILLGALYTITKVVIRYSIA